MRSVQYQLWLKNKNVNHLIVYAEGISPLFMKLEDTVSFKIKKIVYESGNSETHTLTRYFILFQRCWRKRRQILRKAFRAIRARQLGLPYSFE